MHKILVLMNGWRDKKVGSGGDYHILSVLKDWSKQHEISVITPRLGYASTRSWTTQQAIQFIFLPMKRKREVYLDLSYYI